MGAQASLSEFDEAELTRAMRECKDADRARVLDMARAYLRAGRAAEPSFAFTHLSGLSLVASCFRRYPQLAPALLNVAHSSFLRDCADGDVGKLVDREDTQRELMTRGDWNDGNDPNWNTDDEVDK